MGWKQRLDLSHKLIQQIKQLSTNQEQCQLLDQCLQQFSDVGTKEWLKQDEDFKELSSLQMFTQVLQLCAGLSGTIISERIPEQPVCLTIEQAKKKLVEDYLKSLENGDNEIASLNVQQWLDENNILIEDQEQKEVSSSSK